jgi:hypothetical protein
VLAGLALVTLVAKFVIERRMEAESRDLAAARTVEDSPSQDNLQGSAA